jgi:hypothetical protein
MALGGGHVDEAGVRRAITQAQFNQQYGGMLAGELIIVASVVGGYFGSWGAGGATFAIGLAIIWSGHSAAMTLGLILGLSWGITGWLLGTMFGQVGASVVLAVLFAMMGMGANIASANWIRDMNSGQKI